MSPKAAHGKPLAGPSLFHPQQTSAPSTNGGAVTMRVAIDLRTRSSAPSGSAGLVLCVACGKRAAIRPGSRHHAQHVIRRVLLQLVGIGWHRLKITAKNL